MTFHTSSYTLPRTVLVPTAQNLRTNQVVTKTKYPEIDAFSSDKEKEKRSYFDLSPHIVDAEMTLKKS